jgi:CheY-like chemotaxis protein/HPt (histidine-containing phosphotransfer) domain-containing protein
MRHTLVEMLNGWGCRADDAVNAPDALSRLRTGATEGNPYRVALIDLNLQGMDGEELGAAIRSYSALDDTRTVLMTSVGRKGDAARAQSLGFSAYLLKPVKSTELHDAMIQLIRNTIADGAPTALVTRHSLAEARRGRMRILLVEDNPVNKLVTEWALRRHGYSVDSVMTGKQGLTAGERQRYDMIVVDSQLPDIEGRQVIDRLRAQQRHGNDIPIVALEGDAAFCDRESLLAAGAVDTVGKPVNLGALCEMIERWTRAAARHQRAPETDAAASPEPIAPAESREAPSHGESMDGADSEPEQSDPAQMMPLDTHRLEDTSMGIPSLRNALLRTFLSDVHPRLSRLATTIASGESRQVEFEAHGLKGMAATIGAEACVAVFGEIERLGREGKQEGMSEALERARVEVDRAQRDIEGESGMLEAA